MKCLVLFLVLSMVVLMAEPGECIFGLIFRGITRGTVGFLMQLEKRSIDYNTGQHNVN
uniref:Uncharacterized protein n=1 Tax=Mola mola TaxID=94237 RepID=A0A3Q3XC96_MOLML